MGSPFPEGMESGAPNVTGCREGVEGAIEEGTSDGVPEREVALANSLGGTVGVERSPRVG
jgi:hypothetical protein